jgi:hypothetical protein
MTPRPLKGEAMEARPLRRIRELARARKADDLVDEPISEAVVRACWAGASWSDIADALSGTDAAGPGVRAALPRRESA